MEPEPIAYVLARVRKSYCQRNTIKVFALTWYLQVSSILRHCLVIGVTFSYFFLLIEDCEYFASASVGGFRGGSRRLI